MATVAEDIPVVTGEVLDAVESIPLSPKAWFAIGLGVGLAAGAAAAYFAISKRLRKEYEAKAEEEISQMREHFRQKVVAFHEREETKRPLEDLVEEQGYVSTTPPPPPREQPPQPPRYSLAEKRAIMQAAAEEADEELIYSADTGWDYEAEIRNRTEEMPYVIHEDEKGEKGYDVETLTFYEGDNVLAGDGGHIVEDPDEVVGVQFQDKWGHGSSDPATVFIRNDYLGKDYEVCRATGTYAETVHGFRHSDEPFQRRLRRMPEEDGS